MLVNPVVLSEVSEHFQEIQQPGLLLMSVCKIGGLDDHVPSNRDGFRG